MTTARSQSEIYRKKSLQGFPTTRHKAFVCLVIGVVLGSIVGALISRLGDYDFRRYVNMFHPQGSFERQWLSWIADYARGMQPIAWFGATIGGSYACWRLKREFDLIVMFGIVGGVIGFTNSGYVMADPGPNYSTHYFVVPSWCFAMTLLGAIVQASRWSTTKRIRRKDEFFEVDVPWTSSRSHE